MNQTVSQTRTTRFSRRALLIALNAGLLGTLGAVLYGPQALAQVSASRAPGEYAVIGGEMPGSNNNTIFVIDAANREMIALEWNESTRKLDGVGFRNLATDVQGRASR
ncbi:MAG: hypothetical protein ACI89L_001938 [Phycisphaerales bacterium]|jgi:hypothetical protein